MKNRYSLLVWTWILIWQNLLHAQKGNDAVKIQPSNIRAHVRFLSSDLMEGRLPATRGGDLAAHYIATQFELAGLKPVNKDSYFQMVPMVGMNADPNMQMVLDRQGSSLELNYRKDFVAWAGIEKEEVTIRNGEVVFVGYGISAPEVPWDDYKGTDVRGKILMMLVNDPPSDDPGFFGGKALTYYGRWTYKLEEAARRGALGVLLVHNTDMAGYPWQVVEGSWTGEQFSLPQEVEKSSVIEAWITEARADEVLKAAGLNFAQARERAGKADFRSVPLGWSMNLSVNSSIRKVESPNVVGLLEGIDARLKNEIILITTHYDHLGIGIEVEGDSIYNGAFDNASGTGGMLELARVMAAQRPRWSILFAAVTAEEQGLIGSEYYARHPLFPLSRTAANINFDSISVWEESENIITMGAERSSLDEVVRNVASEMRIVISPDPFPEKGHFFRSDQFSLVKVGVPAVYLDPGLMIRGKPEGWGERMMNEYTEKRYHQPSDEFDPSWSFEGAAQMMEFARRTALKIANSESMPRWKPGDQFEALRKKNLAEEGKSPSALVR
ncbi:MAG: M28 family peptidase [Acidobacteria bacterium]|nr:M28 family peptidase [Acidobacteriota bacterium]